MWDPAFGRHIRELRILAGIPLRRFCVERGLDPAVWSALERGRESPTTAGEAVSRIPAFMAGAKIIPPSQPIPFGFSGSDPS